MYIINIIIISGHYQFFCVEFFTKLTAFIIGVSYDSFPDSVHFLVGVLRLLVFRQVGLLCQISIFSLSLTSKLQSSGSCTTHPLWFAHNLYILPFRSFDSGSPSWGGESTCGFPCIFGNHFELVIF